MEASEAAGELRRYAEGLEAGADRAELAESLEAAEERLTALDRLKRKHGGTIAAVLAHADDCRAQRDAHSVQVPKISMVCETSTNPCWPATLSAHDSTAGPSTSKRRRYL